MRHLIRQLIREHACACEEMGMELPEPGVAYPIEIDEIIVEPVMDSIFPEGPSIALDMMSFPAQEEKKASKGTKMARAKMFRMAKQAQSFHDRIEDDQYLPQWVMDKLAIAEDKLQDAYNYIEYKLHRMKMEGKIVNETIIRKEIRKYLS